MDWTYKHFHQEAIYHATPASVLEAARTLMASVLPRIENTPDGFVGQGESAWHDITATFRTEATADGTKLAVELLVERMSLWGYMLTDIGGYYNGQIRKWLLAVAERLGQSPIVISKPTLQQSCLTGCLVYLVVGTALTLLALPLDHLFFAQAARAGLGPLTIFAGLLGLMAGGIAFLYKSYPDAAIWGSRKG